MKIAVIDYAMGNIHSVCKALEKVAGTSKVILTNNIKEIEQADKIILPGQGAISACMQTLRDKNLIEVLLKVAKNKPFLGICIGPQLMSQFSEENGGVEGLGLFDCKTIKFRVSSQNKLKIPHMGWNNVKQTAFHPLWKNIADNSYFYYVHSFYLTDNQYVIGTTEYGQKFTAAIANENLIGFQAHPEKSGKNGLQFLQNFVDWKI